MDKAGKGQGKPKSRAHEAIHSSAKALHKVGAIDNAAMEDFDERCLEEAKETSPGER